MTDEKSMGKEMQELNVRDSLFDIYDKTQSYVRVTDDDQEAWLYLVEKEDESFYSKEELLDFLENNGVRYGINEDNLIAMARKKVYEREIKVAVATEAIAGQDGYYEYYVDVTGDVKKPKIREDGSVDYQSMNMVNSVQAGTPLALYHPAKEGIPGIGVTGTSIPVNPVKNLLPLQGRNIIHSEEDPNLYIAQKEGKVEYKDGKLDINSVYELRGDVDQLIGKVEFYGDVVISGNVESGVVIRAGKSLTIEGTVEAATIVAGGDIILKRGIQGNQKASIVCRGDLYADFIEHTQVKANGNVEANIILSSQIEAEGKVTLTGKKGAIIGGYVHGTKGIDCKNLGNDAEVKTEVHAGCQPEIYQENLELNKRLEKLKNSQKRLVNDLKEIEMYVKKTGAITPTFEKRVAEIKEEMKGLTEDMQSCNAKLASIMVYMQKAKDALIRIDGNLHKGSIICIGQGRLPIENSTVYMEYRNISGMIAGKVIVKN